jgi:hypothetical protein
VEAPKKDDRKRQSPTNLQSSENPPFFGIPQKLKLNEQYGKTNEKFSEVPIGDGDNWFFPSLDRVHR